MYDLHLHLDGSMTPEFLMKAAQLSNVTLPFESSQELLPLMEAPLHCKSLNEYLEKFALPLSVLQTQIALEELVYDTLRTLSASGLTGVELRFAPQLHMQNGLPMEAVIEACLSGLSRGVSDFKIKAGLLLCCMRQLDYPNLNKETIRLAHTYRSQGVLGADLAGAEALYGTELFEDIFTLARQLDIPFTIHAGEAADYRSIQKALQFGAKRIGHGVRCLESPSLVDYIGTHQIPLEMCPSSNVQTKAVASFMEHPILSLLRQGLLVTVNTDNMTVSNTTLDKEFSLLEQHLLLSAKEKDCLIANSKKASFLELH